MFGLARGALLWPGSRFHEKATPIPDENAEGGELRGVERHVGDGRHDDTAHEAGRQSARHGLPAQARPQGRTRVAVCPRAGHVPMAGIGVVAGTALDLAYGMSGGGAGVDGYRYMSDAAERSVRHAPSVLLGLRTEQARPVAVERTVCTGAATSRNGRDSRWGGPVPRNVAVVTPPVAPLLRVVAVSGRPGVLPLHGPVHAGDPRTRRPGGR